MSPTIRYPAVSGRFYSSNSKELSEDVRAFYEGSGERKSAVGCVVPHAGYMYSGHVAGAVYAAIDLPRRFVMLGPNHTGMGAPLAIMSSGRWLTPLGEAEIDTDLAAALKEELDCLTEDELAHRREHGLEVQLPFLQSFVPGFHFVPITIGVGGFAVLEAIGEGIAKVLARLREPVLLIASSDMNHYESDWVTRTKDQKAIARILAMDPSGLHQVVRSESVSMCGYGPVVVMLTAARHLGQFSARLVRYATSGDVSGDLQTVVGYAGIVVQEGAFPSG